MALPTGKWLPEQYLFNNPYQVFVGYLPIFAGKYSPQLNSGLQSTPDRFFEKCRNLLFSSGNSSISSVVMVTATGSSWKNYRINTVL
jgi:hypothetical protein